MYILGGDESKLSWLESYFKLKEFQLGSARSLSLQLVKKISARKFKSCTFFLIFLGFSENFSIFNSNYRKIISFFLKMTDFLVLKLLKAKQSWDISIFESS